MALVEEKDKCKKENRVPPKSLSDISGNRYGRLVVEYPVYDGTRWRWHCKCDCGKSKDVIPPDLKRGMVKSCGCFRIDFRKKDLTGMRFNHLTVLRVADDDMKHHGQRWVCKCDCGKEIITRSDGLQSGHTRSCGCENKRRETHGRSKTKLFKTWAAMKQRCQNVNCDHYKNYGGRGISVCEEWQEFEPFYVWAIENGYSEDLTIDRINNDGNYCPENCRWATRMVQTNNRRNTVYVSYNGEKHSLREWSEITGINRDTLDNRIRSGWSAEKALFEPVKNRKRV